MQNILTAAGCGQLALSLIVMDWSVTAIGLILGIAVFGSLVACVGRALEEAQPGPRQGSRTRKITRIV